MTRPTKQIAACDEERLQLERLLNSRTLPVGQHVRIQIVLHCMAGKTLAETAALNHVSQQTASRWRDRYIALGLEGLRDLPRSGRPSQYAQSFEESVLRTLQEPPPAGHGCWTGALLAEKTGYSKHAVWRFLRRQRISLARRRSWCVSTDPEFAAKAAEVVGLYLSPPENALVLCVDEKPNIQALERGGGYVTSSDRRTIQGYESTYKRHGTLNLFAALEVATGRIHDKTTPPEEKTKKGFLTFLEEVLADLPVLESVECHVIMDNHSIHKRHEAWLSRHPRVYFHYTPTSASWLNMVEIWFGILTVKSLRGANFRDTGQLGAHIRAFVESYNEHAHPFVWRKRKIKGAQLSYSINNFRN